MLVDTYRNYRLTSHHVHMALISLFSNEWKMGSVVCVDDQVSPSKARATCQEKRDVHIVLGLI